MKKTESTHTHTWESDGDRFLSVCLSFCSSVEGNFSSDHRRGSTGTHNLPIESEMISYVSLIDQQIKRKCHFILSLIKSRNH